MSVPVHSLAVRDLIELRAGLVHAARHLDCVLDAVAGGETSVDGIARRTGLQSEVARRILFLLEQAGLVASTRFMVTPEGRRVVAEMQELGR